MIHSARPTVSLAANIVFCCFVLLDLKSGDGRTDGQHVRKQWSLPDVTVGWPSGSIQNRLLQRWPKPGLWSCWTNCRRGATEYSFSLFISSQVFISFWNRNCEVIGIVENIGIQDLKVTHQAPYKLFRFSAVECFCFSVTNGRTDKQAPCVKIMTTHAAGAFWGQLWV